MKTLRAMAVFSAVAVASVSGAEPSQKPHVGGSRVALATSFDALQFRTDINPALRYYQAFLEMPNPA